MKKLILIFTIFAIFLLHSFALFSNQSYFLDGNNRIELNIDSSKKYILYENEQSIKPLLQNVRQVRAGTNEIPSQKMRESDFITREWAVVEVNEMQLSNIVRSENIFQKVNKFDFLKDV